MCKDDTLSSGTAFLYPFCVCIHLCQRNNLNLVCFGVPENNLAVRQEHIPDQNASDSRSATSAVQQEVNNYPVAVFAEIAIRRRLFQQTQQLLIRIRLFDRLDLFVIWNIECRITFLCAPVQKCAEDAQITADGVLRKTILTHRNDHPVKVSLLYCAKRHFRMLLEHIDRQIALGTDGYICIKANSVTEREVIDKLVEASRAGVEVQLIIRGICCILPGVPGQTEHIHVTSVVGRFLEHGRIYQFGRGENAGIYISSADLMTRNLNRRVEIACPVHDARLREQLQWILDSQLRDTAKASLLLPDGSYCSKHSAVAFDSQAYFMQQSPHIPAQPGKEPPKLIRQLRRLIKGALRA